MRTIISKLVEDNPRHYSAMIKRNPELYSAIEKQVGDTIPEKVYNYLEIGDKFCPNAKFRSMTDGYKFCGNAGKCECARVSVSEKVSYSKKQLSESEKLEITKKRVSTVLDRYGVDNTGKLEQSKNAHTEFYSNKKLVEASVESARLTKLELYGDEKYNNSDKIRDTFKKKRNDGFWVDKFWDKEIVILQDKAYLKELYETKSIDEIAKLCNVHVQTVYRYLNEHNIRDPFKSSDEQEIVIFLRSLGVNNIVQNTRKLLPSKREIDIYLPDYDLAIEYNGVYWHHEDISHITRTYHSDKFNECAKFGIQLITIFSNFWHYKKEIVKNILKNKLGIVPTLTFARKCKIIELTSAESRAFLDKFHIQGYATSSIRYGLEYMGELVAIMTFGVSRSGAGIGKKEDSHELIRFASSGRIPGAASKLLKHFIKYNNPVKLVSYSDNEWSIGKLYQELGFRLESDIAPSYWYISPKSEKFQHRYNYAKHKLIKLGYSSDMSEREITRQMGLLKIWDCGKKRWVLE